MNKVAKARRGIGAFISSEKGQRFFNFAYSIGAAIVIWGALFKILHLPGGNMLLSIGMGTEVLMFVLTAFDRPPREYKWENVFPDLDKAEKGSGAEEGADDADTASDAYAVYPAAGRVASGAGGYAAPTAPGVVEPAEATDVASATAAYLDEINLMTTEMRRLHESTSALNKVSDTLLESYRAITENSENITRSSSGYVEQMSALNHNIQGLNTIYEIQLKSISSQLDAIERVNRGIKDIRDMYEKSARQSARYCEETEKMARYMQQLNSVYEKMIHAMTVNPLMGMNGYQAQDEAVYKKEVKE